MTGRLILDFLMAILILFALAYRITGDVTHEWTGVCAFALLVMHNVIHWPWYRRIFQGRFNFRRILNTIVNILLLVTSATLIITGLLHSRTILSFMQFSGEMLLRQTHTFAAYWCLLIVSIHIGMHWEIIIDIMLKRMKNMDISRLPAIVMRCIAAIVMIYGLNSFFERDMPAKLFLGYSFDFWDENKNSIIFFTNSISIMAVYISITHYSIKIAKYIKYKLSLQLIYNTYKTME
ncbi:MAG: DUF4405 domain-containing protein [Desulfovibrio sp.]|nr:DUF4405 domain-containing protein [Desulfovibrio sp.]